MSANRRYLASISYDGSSFNGWAKQEKLFTVQGFIERTVSSLFFLDEFKILASSRTDKGVHALDQKFAFAFPLKISHKRLAIILENGLQQFVKLNKLEKIPSTFHPLRSVWLKEYRYYINIGKDNLFLRNYCWNYNSSINISELRKLLKIFEGSHDFFNFSYCRTREWNKRITCREIEKISVSLSGEFLTIKIFAKSFLRYQIRAIIGEAVTMVGKIDACETLGKMLNAEIPQKYKKLAPAGGLYLWKIVFKG